MTIGISNFDRTNPTETDDSTTIPTAVNDLFSQLNGPLNADNNGNAGPGVINLLDASKFPNAGWVTINSEIISYSGKSGNALQGCVRGAQGSQIASHADRTLVGQNFTAAHFNMLAAAIIALQQLFVNFKTDTGNTDGSANIALTATPITGKKIALVINGVTYIEGTDFTRAGTVLTLSGAGPFPPAGLAYLATYFSK